ncbi:MAG: hypothetical protein Q8L98_01025 [Chlamydiales bacterium]|nr:hypothetical protein [Chlamydiales bacterium]
MKVVAIRALGLSGGESIVFLLERKKTLTAEIARVKELIQVLRDEHEKTVAYLQKQQNEWDEKNGALQTRNKVSQIRNHALKERVTYFSRGFNAHACPPFTPMGVAWRVVVNSVREDYRKNYPRASTGEFLYFLSLK